MKKFIKGKWFPLALAAVIAAILALILFLFGFRITYSPELDNNWDAVSACASWAGVITSFVAIWFAIKVPKKIADRQDKIALFEKRYKVYDILSNCISFSYSISYSINKMEHTNKILNREDIQMLFIVSFSTHNVFSDKSNTELLKECNEYAVNARIVLDTASFLFDCNTDDYIDPIIKGLFELLFFKGDSDMRKEYCKVYQLAVQKMQKELLKQIKYEMSILIK